MDPNDQKKTACYDIDVEVDDPLKAQMSNFLASTTNQQEIASLDAKVRGAARGAWGWVADASSSGGHTEHPLPQIHETIESINQLKTQRDFMLSFSNNPQDFIQEWIKSQRRDLKVKPWSWAERRGGWPSPGVTLPILLTLCPAQIITDVIGNPEEERRAEFYQQPWAQEAVGRHIFAKVGSGPCLGECCRGWDSSGGSLGQPLTLPDRPHLL